MRTSVQDRLLGALGAALVVTTLGWLLLSGLSVEIGARTERLMTLLDLHAPRPLRPKPPVPRPAARKASGRSSPRNLRNKATEIVVPPPPSPPPIVPPVVSAVKPGVGMAPSNGASDLRGPGEGAGGEGNGTGSGGEGDGDGSGDVPPRQIHGRLSYADLPRDLREAGVAGTVFVQYAVEPDGRVGECVVMESSGNAELDETTCRLIQQRFRFDPSRDGQGRPIESQVTKRNYWIVPRDGDPPRP